jgi:isoprenylcysteine carboxyl methyltransferase (ICMT) family protein YpbQ
MFADIARGGLAHELVVFLVQSLQTMAVPRVGDVWALRIYILPIGSIPATDIQVYIQHPI